MKNLKFKTRTRRDDNPNYSDTLISDYVLVHKGTYERYAIGGVPKGEEGRQEHGGPMVPGPWHYIYGLCTVIAGNPEYGTGAEMERKDAAGLVFEIWPGMILEIDGLKYEVIENFNKTLSIVGVAKKKGGRK